MPEFEVQGMTCAHCQAAVARAVRSVDPAAGVAVDLAAGRVSVETTADPAPLKRAIAAAGYQVDAPRP